MSKALTGKWQWNGEIKPMYAMDHGLEHYVWFKSGFKSNGQRYEGIRFIFDEFWRLEYTAWSGYVGAGEGHCEDDYATPFEQYRVIDFGTGSEADDDSDGTFVEWFLSNVTRYGTVADKLEQIAENEKAVYQSGYDKALEKDGYNEGFEDGKQAEYDAFWDALQNYGKRTEYSATFAQWNIEYIRPKYKVVPTQSSVGSLFNNNKKLLAVEKNYFDFSQITTLNADYICNACDKLLVFEDCGLPALDRYARCWRYCSNLHTIEVIRSNENTTFTYAFENCTSLENLTIEGTIGQNIDFQWSTLLTHASIKSIIEHLSLSPSIANGKTLTLSKKAVDAAIEGNIWSEEHQSVNYVKGRGSETDTWRDLIAPAVYAGWNISLVV